MHITMLKAEPWIHRGSFTLDHADRGRQCGQRGPVPSHLDLTMVTTV